MDALCLLVAGVVRATLPTAEFTLAWDHSVEKTRWEEHYQLDGDALMLVLARVQGTGAGMEPPPSATLEGGWWTWRPLTRVPALRLTLSPYTADYALCRRGTCSALAALVGAAGETTVVTIERCAPS
jgi:hypothetical protein